MPASTCQRRRHTLCNRSGHYSEARARTGIHHSWRGDFNAIPTTYPAVQRMAAASGMLCDLGDEDWASGSKGAPTCFAHSGNGEGTRRDAFMVTQELRAHITNFLVEPQGDVDMHCALTAYITAGPVAGLDNVNALDFLMDLKPTDQKKADWIKRVQEAHDELLQARVHILSDM